MREEDIRAAIEQMPEDRFERFAFRLLRRVLYPGLNPTSATYDLGEDAHSEWSTLFLHDGKWVSVFASKTAEWSKIEHDCKRCKDTGRTIDVVVFATSGDPRTDVEEGWRNRVSQEFGWRLEVRTVRWLKSVASDPQHDDLVDDYLHIPPPGGDYVQSIDQQFAYHTGKAWERIHLHIPGIAAPLPRREIAWIEEQLGQGKPVLLTGDPGTGKSGIAARLTVSAQSNGLAAILLDARRLGSYQNEAQIRQYLGLNGPVALAVQRMGKYKGCRVIIDQLDSVVGLPAAQPLVELAGDVSGLEGVEVLVVSRKSEKHEEDMTHELLAAGFVELTSYPLGEPEARGALTSIGILNPSLLLVSMACNLLNLELIATIKNDQPDLDFGTLTDEAELWEQYFRMLRDREQTGLGFEMAESVIAEARRLAWIGFDSDDGVYCLEDPMPHVQRRLVSWDVVQNVDGQMYRFRHENLQDFLCAWDAVEKHMMPQPVAVRVGLHRSRSVLVWMDKLYSRRNPELRTRFLREAFHV